MGEIEDINFFFIVRYRRYGGYRGNGNNILSLERN